MASYISKLRKTNRIVLILFILVFFISDNVCNTFGIKIPNYKFILLVLCAFSLSHIKNVYNTLPQAIYLLAFCVLYTIFKIATGGQAGNTMMGMTVTLPVFIYVTYRALEKDSNAYVYKKTLYWAYVAECLTAIFERVTHSHLFQWQSDTDTIEYVMDFDVTEFRSFGLYGHPLQNAVVIVVFILFILVYERNVRKKYALSILGVLAILCFNTRAAIVVSSVCVVFYTIYWLRTEKVSGSSKMILLAIFCGIVGSVYYLFSQGLIGGRLSSMGLYDEDSAGVRVQALDIFRYYKMSDFMFGISQQEIEIIKFRLGLIAVENFWLNWMLGYGCVFIIGLVALYYPLLKKLLKNNTLFEKAFLFVPFILLASTNPSLAVSIIPMTSFLLLSRVMPLANIEKKNR